MDSNNKFAVRQTMIVTRSELAQDFLYPEQIRIQLDKQVRVSPYDIGALAYAQRETGGESKGKYILRPTLVDESSLIQSRRILLDRLFDYIYLSPNRDRTIVGLLSEIRLILDWCDHNGHSLLFNSEEETRSAYQSYVENLRHDISLSRLSPRTANTKQLYMHNMITIFWGDGTKNTIISGVSVIAFKKGKTELPEEKKVIYLTKTLLCLGRGLSRLLIHCKQFPYHLSMPEYCTNLFPSNTQAMVTPYTKGERLIYNYVEGRLSTAEELIDKSKVQMTKSDASARINDALANLQLANDNARHQMRLDYATLAMNAYVQLFILMTGIHRSELVQLEYDGKLEVSKDLVKHSFKSVKFRAAGREVTYNLGSIHGLRVFQEYLKLRAWVLAGESCQMLFFTPNRGSNTLTKTGDKTLSRQFNLYNLESIFQQIKGKFIPKDFKHITAQKVRKYKTLVLNELKVPQQVIANSLNHTLETNHRDYLDTTPDKQQDEMSTYWSSVKKAAEFIKIKLVDDTEDLNDYSIAVGHCDEHDSPSPSMDNSPITPDCKTQYGCLYCEHYCCHADEEDIRKLFSLLYVVQTVCDMAVHFELADRLLKELGIRVQYVIELIKNKSKTIAELVQRLQKDVMDDGNLTSFWEYRLQRYEAMGVVI